METLLHKIRFSNDSMGSAEKRIAAFLLAHSDELIHLSITELAQKCDCGNATIVRFSRRFGLEGYQELKIRLAAELNSASSIGSDIQAEDTCLEIYQKRIANIYNSLSNTESVLDPKQLELAITAIMKADRIVTFGLGNSAAIAHDAAHKFLRLGFVAQSVCDNHMQAIVASHLKRESVAIGISHSGASKDIVEALRLCKIGGATTICITNYGVTPIVEVSDIVLYTKSEETKHSILAMNSRIAQLAIIDSIYTYVVLHSKEKRKQAIYNTEYSLHQKKY